MNVCLFTGRLTRDPELNHTNNGKAVVDFSIAVNEGKEANGEDRVTFVNCQAWDKTAESISKFFTKGKPITVQSRLKNERWTDAEGQSRRSEKFVVERFNFVPSSGKQEEGVEESEVSTPVAPKKPGRKPRTPAPVVADNEGFDTSGGDEEEVPF